MRAFILSICLFASSCACWGESANTRGCIIAKQVLDCAKAEIQDVLPGVVPLVTHLLDGANGDPNWEGYLIGLESMGFDTIACAVQVVTNNLLSTAAALPDGPDLPLASLQLKKSSVEKAKRVEANYNVWKAKRAPNLTIQVK